MIAAGRHGSIVAAATWAGEGRAARSEGRSALPATPSARGQLVDRGPVAPRTRACPSRTRAMRLAEAEPLAADADEAAPRQAAREWPRRSRGPASIGSACDERGATSSQAASSSSSGISTTSPGSTPTTVSRTRQASPSATSMRSDGVELRAAPDLEPLAEIADRSARQDVGDGGQRGAVVAAVGASRRRGRGRVGAGSVMPSPSRLTRQVEEVRRARDARVVRADQLLERVRRDVHRQVEHPRRERRDVGLDGGLVLGRRRDDRGRGDPAVLADLVAVEQQAARRLGGPGGGARPRLPGDLRLARAARSRRRCRARRRSRGPARSRGRRCSGTGCAGSIRARRSRRGPRARAGGAARGRGRSAPPARAGTAGRRCRAPGARWTTGTWTSWNASPHACGASVEAVVRDDPALVHRVLARVVQRDEARLALELRRRRG